MLMKPHDNAALVIRNLEEKRTVAENGHAHAIGSDKHYYAGMCAAYTLALALLHKKLDKRS